MVEFFKIVSEHVALSAALVCLAGGILVIAFGGLARLYSPKFFRTDENKKTWDRFMEFGYAATGLGVFIMVIMAIHAAKP